MTLMGRRVGPNSENWSISRLYQGKWQVCLGSSQELWLAVLWYCHEIKYRYVQSTRVKYPSAPEDSSCAVRKCNRAFDTLNRTENEISYQQISGTVSQDAKRQARGLRGKTDGYMEEDDGVPRA
jgi:hypothetical protein